MMGRVGSPVSTMLRRGFTRRCPVCGQGHLFRHWVSMVESCPRCGLRFARAPGQWLGSWFLNIVLAQVAVVGVLIAGVASTWPDPPMVPITILVVVVALGVPLAFFPFSRTIWTAIDLAMRPLDFDDGVSPGFVLEEDRERWRTEERGAA
jgi:uncharacterized protein (DUF983 family)